MRWMGIRGGIDDILYRFTKNIMMRDYPKIPEPTVRETTVEPTPVAGVSILKVACRHARSNIPMSYALIQ